MAYKIVVDAGGGGVDPDGVYGVRNAKEDSIRLAKEVGKILENNNVEVIYTGTTNIYQSPYERAEIANEAGADYVISLHSNLSDYPNNYSEVTSYVYEMRGRKLEIAENINLQLESIGFQNLGVYAKPDLPLLSSTRMQTVVVMIGYSNSDIDHEIFDHKVKKVAIAIATGILESFENNASIYNHLYSVQVGIFKVKSHADNLLYELQSQGYPAFITKSDEYYRVRVGLYEDMESAVRLESKLRGNGFSTYITMNGILY